MTEDPKDEIGQLHKQIRRLELQLAELRAGSAATERWLGVVGLIVIAMWAYTTFWQMPRAVDESNFQELYSQVSRMRDEARDTLLPQLRGDIAEAEMRLADLRLDQDVQDELRGMIERILRPEVPFSVAGTAAHGERVAVPWGSVADWNIILSPLQAGLWEEVVDYNTDNALLEFRLAAIPDGDDGWRIEAVQSHYGARNSDAVVHDLGIEVSYLLVPSGSGSTTGP